MLTQKNESTPLMDKKIVDWQIHRFEDLALTPNLIGSCRDDQPTWNDVLTIQPVYLAELKSQGLRAYKKFFIYSFASNWNERLVESKKN